MNNIYYFCIDENTSNRYSCYIQDNKGDVIFEYEDEDIEEVGSSLYQLGYLENPNDVSGMYRYLVEMGFIDKNDILVLKV